MLLNQSRCRGSGGLACVSSLFGEFHVSAWKADQDSSSRRCCCFHFSCWLYWIRWLQTLSNCTRRLSLKQTADLKSSISGLIWGKKTNAGNGTNQSGLTQALLREMFKGRWEQRGSREQVKDAKNPNERLMFRNAGSASCFSGLCWLCISWPTPAGRWTETSTLYKRIYIFSILKDFIEWLICSVSPSVITLAISVTERVQSAFLTWDK